MASVSPYSSGGNTDAQPTLGSGPTSPTGTGAARSPGILRRFPERLSLWGPRSRGMMPRKMGTASPREVDESQASLPTRPRNETRLGSGMALEAMSACETPQEGLRALLVSAQTISVATW
jgi:hypothetical protein